MCRFESYLLWQHDTQLLNELSFQWTSYPFYAFCKGENMEIILLCLIIALCIASVILTTMILVALKTVTKIIGKIVEFFNVF